MSRMREQISGYRNAHAVSRLMCLLLIDGLGYIFTDGLLRVSNSLGTLLNNMRESIQAPAW